MGKYAVMYEDVRQDKDNLSPDLLNGHVEHLRGLYSQGKVLMYGTLESNGYYRGKGLLIFEAASQEEVESYILADPFIIRKWYAGYHIYKWDEVAATIF